MSNYYHIIKLINELQIQIIWITNNIGFNTQLRLNPNSKSLHMTTLYG